MQVVVINKKDFMDLDNPLLAWMLDSDAVTTVLRVRFSPDLKHIYLQEGWKLFCKLGRNFTKCLILLQLLGKDPR